MQGASRAAYAAFDERLDAALASTGADAGQRAAAIGDSLFAFADMLRAQPAVRRALTDTGRSPDDRAAFVRRLVGDRVDPAATELVEAAVRDRWRSPGELTSATEEFGVAAHLAAAHERGRLDAVQDEVFRFGQIVQGDPDLRTALLDQAAPARSRRELVRRLLEDKASPETLRLVEQVVLGRRDRKLEEALERIGELAAERRHRRVAVVRVAAPLSSEHRERLERALSAQAGRAVQLNVVVEPGLVGGLKVEIGDDVVDGTVRSRLADLQRRLAEN
ncbi:MAG TPA: F0F1 ATP synthase subunit delta [Jiangellaceae bacterium]|jgi:F-type H+-transporting ATPase subunit delta|nr:F0F1 ATP synthase subunit delta [Jiangellaceae bacterium]